MNGTFIAAAIHCGFDFTPIEKGNNPQNLFFKFNYKDLRKKRGEHVY
jgi:hypothetical protein